MFIFLCAVECIEHEVSYKLVEYYVIELNSYVYVFLIFILFNLLVISTNHCFVSENLSLNPRLCTLVFSLKNPLLLY